MSHLTEELLATLKHKLAEEKQRLRGEIRDELLRSDEEKYGSLAGLVHDTGDESVADLLSDINTAMIGNLIRELREVEAALERIAENSYGRCDDCDVEIPYERLLANPSALRCVSCQEQHEKLYAEGGKPAL